MSNGSLASAFRGFIAPVAFVFVWSTGFIVAAAIAGRADVTLFLAIRFALSTALLGLSVCIGRGRWPARQNLWRHLLAGACLQGGYVLGGYGAVQHGMNPAIMSLIAAFQPLMTALAASLVFKARMGAQAWLGIVIATLGISLIVQIAGDAMVSGAALLLAFFSVASGTAGSVAQGGAISRDPILGSAAIQNAGAFAVAMAALLVWGDASWSGDATLWIALLWSAVALSCTSATFLVFILRSEGAAKATALTLLAPPLAAVQASIFFDRNLNLTQLSGMAIVLIGVALARLAPRRDAVRASE